MDRIIWLWILAVAVIGTSNGQMDCEYLDIEWAASQADTQVGNGGPYSMNASPNIYTSTSKINVTFIATLPYSLLFIQANVRGGLNTNPVGTWLWSLDGTDSGFPIYCGAPSNSLIDKSSNQPGVRRFTWTAPHPFSGVTDELEFRATVIEDSQLTQTTWFGLTTSPIAYTDPCDPDPCQNDGACLVDSQTFGYQCHCINGYTGTNCQIPTTTNPCNRVICQNGGICTGGNPICNCPNGWTGTYCNVQVATPCSTNVCQNGGTCVISGLSFVCSCTSSWTGSFCQNLITAPNPCDANPCFYGGTCILNLQDPRGFICRCAPNYSGDVCQTFVPPCSSNPCLNSGLCQQTTNPIGFQCICPPLFEGQTCQISPSSSCSPNPCRNSGVCQQSSDPSGYRCECLPQFGGDMCEVSKPVPCESNPCQNGGTCFTNTLDYSFICQCEGPWTGPVCDQRASDCDPNPCGSGGTCVPQSDSFVCTCNDVTGALGEPCMIGPCIPDPCMNGGTCFTRNDGIDYLCDCMEGFTGSTCQQDNTITAPPSMTSAPTKPIIITPTQPNIIPSPMTASPASPTKLIPTSLPTTKPITTSLFSNTCDSMPCMNGGICLFGDNDYFCQCPGTHRGKQCQISAIATSSPPITPTNRCNPNPCMNGGTCQSISGVVVICTCPSTHIGTNCDIEVNNPSPTTTPTPTTASTKPTTVPDPCINNPCMNNGVCIPSVNDRFTCTCPDTHTGVLCQTPVSTEPNTPTMPTIVTTIADVCASTPCMNGGQCVQTGTTYTCICLDGYIGQLCEEDKAECASVPCQNGGECVDEINGYACICIDGYDGINCETPPQSCTDYCMNDGVCSTLAIINIPICACVNGFVGTRCQFAPCRPGYCVNGGTCSVVEVGTDEFEYQCECTIDFTGPQCNLGVTCANSPCMNGATCADTGSTPFCNCVLGFYGTHCEFDIDECSTRPCLNQGICTQGINSYTCQCKKGYTGTNCETQEITVDHCAVAMCNEANTIRCLNSASQAKGLCVCADGFKGNTCDEEDTTSSGSQRSNSNDANAGGLLLQPWWIGLISLILVLMVTFIIIVICVQRFESKKETALLQRTGSENAIY